MRKHWLGGHESLLEVWKLWVYFLSVFLEQRPQDPERRPPRPDGTKRARGAEGGYLHSGPDCSLGGGNIIGKKPKKAKSLEAGKRDAFSGLGTRGWPRWLQSQGFQEMMPLPENSCWARVRVKTELPKVGPE